LYVKKLNYYLEGSMVAYVANLIANLILCVSLLNSIDTNPARVEERKVFTVEKRIEYFAKAANVDVELFMATMLHESGGTLDPKCVGDKWIDPKNPDKWAYGVGQVRKTAFDEVNRRYGKYLPNYRFEQMKNNLNLQLLYAVLYFRLATVETDGSTEQVLTAYNAGYHRAKNGYETDETRNYVKSVKSRLTDRLD
jgi:hypothetical protein